MSLQDNATAQIPVAESLGAVIALHAPADNGDSMQVLVTAVEQCLHGLGGQSGVDAELNYPPPIDSGIYII